MIIIIDCLYSNFSSDTLYDGNPVSVNSIETISLFAGARRLVSLLGLYFLFLNDLLVRRPVKSWLRWGPVWIFFVGLGNISLSDAWPSGWETANYFSANQNWHPVSTALVSWRRTPPVLKLSPVSGYFFVGWLLQCEPFWLCAVCLLLLYSLAGISNV